MNHGRWRKNPAREISVATQPIVNLSFDEAQLLIEAFGCSRGAATLGSGRLVRQFVDESLGDGHWDFVRPSPHLMVSITEATYKSDYQVIAAGTPLFKVRLLLEGRILNCDGSTLLEAPKVQLHIATAGEQTFLIPANEPIRLVVLHCWADFLTSRLALSHTELPKPLDALFAPAPQPTADLNMGLSPNYLQCAQRLMDARGHQSDLRGIAMDAVSTDLLCQIISELEQIGVMRSLPFPMRRRDIALVHDARRILDETFAAPLTIPSLARRVGMNQTKLKAAFKAFTGQTIYNYIVERRMQKACELLADGELSVSEVGYTVGYEFANNFSSAFRRFTGQSPARWRASEQRQTE